MKIFFKKLGSILLGILKFMWVNMFVILAIASMWLNLQFMAILCALFYIGDCITRGFQKISDQEKKEQVTRMMDIFKKYLETKSFESKIKHRERSIICPECETELLYTPDGTIGQVLKCNKCFHEFKRYEENKEPTETEVKK